MRFATQVRAGLLLAALAGPAGAAEPPLGCPLDFERTLVDLANAERAVRGLPLLEMDVRLMQAAQRHSDDMAAHDFLSHTGSDGSDPSERIEAAGYLDWDWWGENAGAGYPTPESVVAGWLASAGHRANLLSPVFDHVGVGYAERAGTRYGRYWTQVFGSSALPPESPVGTCPACSDGVDNDADGFADYGADAQCSGDPRHWNELGACGLGFELALLLPALGALRARRARQAVAGDGRGGSSSGSSRSCR